MSALPSAAAGGDVDPDAEDHIVLVSDKDEVSDVGSGLNIDSKTGLNRTRRDARTERQRAAAKHASRSGMMSCNAGCFDTCCCRTRTRRIASALFCLTIVIATIILVYYLVCWPDTSSWIAVSWNDPRFGAAAKTFAPLLVPSLHPRTGRAPPPVLHPSSKQFSTFASTDSFEPISEYAPPPVATVQDPSALAPNTRIAYFGDVQLGTSGERVYQLVATMNAHAVVMPGDLDYHNNPNGWRAQIEANIPAHVPVFITSGNHDGCKWPAYQSAQLELLRRANVTGLCDGVIGVRWTCVVRGMVFAMTGPGLFTSDDYDYADYTDRAFRHPQLSRAIWKTCAWHKNQRAMQTGAKPDEVGWSIYQTCLRHSALVITGHEHSYSRTKLLTSFVEQTIANASALPSDPVRLSSAAGVAIVTGCGGESIRSGTTLNGADNYWAAEYNADSTNGPQTGSPVVGGVLFCTYHIDNDPLKASCEYRLITADGVPAAGTVVDQWIMYTQIPPDS